jgi:hypothetical protein
MELIHAFHLLRHPNGILTWAFPLIAGLFVYFKFSRTINPPAFRTAKQMLIASGACFLMGLLFALGGTIDVHLSEGKELAAYFGLAFPQPPGRFAAMSLMCALPGLLFALHAAYSKIRQRNARS